MASEHINRPIPKAVLDAAHRKLCRRVAACILQAMAESDIGPDMVDFRLDLPKGTTQRRIARLMTGRTNEMRMVSDLACALDFEPVFSIYRPCAVQFEQHPEPPADRMLEP